MIVARPKELAGSLPDLQETSTPWIGAEKSLTYCKGNYGAYAYLQYQGLDTDWGSAFNITPGNYNVVDGKVVHSFTTQAFRDYLTKMNDWYKKGLFNDDFYNDTDITTVRTDMANDLCYLCRTAPQRA